MLGVLSFRIIANTAVGASPIIEGCSIFPSDNIWNTPVDNLPVHSSSFTYINAIGADAGFHPDFAVDTWTSADAAGLPILSGLVTYEEVMSGEITHAIRFTAPQTQKAHVWPARHDASNLTNLVYPPMGQRFRLKTAFDVSGFPVEIQTILTAFKKYGIILADNGSAWYISGAPDERWDNDVLRLLRQVKGSDFEAVDVSSLMIDENSGAAKQSPDNSTFYVGDDDCEGKYPCFNSIEAAINAATADTRILISQGTYADIWEIES